MNPEKYYSYKPRIDYTLFKVLTRNIRALEMSGINIIFIGDFCEKDNTFVCNWADAYCGL